MSTRRTVRTSLLASALCLGLAATAAAQTSGGSGSGTGGGSGSAAGSVGGTATPAPARPSSAPALNAPAGNPALGDPSAVMPNPNGLGVAPPANPMDSPGTAAGPATGALPGSTAQRQAPAAQRDAPLPSCTSADCGTPTIMAPP